MYFEDIFMAFYLKKTRLKGRTYLSIDESFYNHEKRGTAHRCYKSLGSVETHMANGMDDPIAHFQKEVDALNAEHKKPSEMKISDVSPVTHLGYFPLQVLLQKMKIKKYIDLFKLTNDFQFDLYEILSALIFSRAVLPCSKNRTFHDVIPNLYDNYSFSYDQLLDALSFLGTNYEKIVELFNVQVQNVFGLNTDKTYFDCTNFYFEIDREDDFRRKGPSKENRKDPIVGLGLLLDKNQIPIGMQMYPGNESEKPVLREVIDSLKKRNNVIGKTIHVADKGLNCIQNIAFSKQNGDGYLFSKSVKTLPEIEKEWVLLDQDYTDVKNSSGKLLYRKKSCIDKFPYKVMANGKMKTVELTEKRLVTYNPSLAAKKRFEINRMAEKAKSLCGYANKKNAYGESAKYITFEDSNGQNAKATINQAAIDKDLRMAGYNLLVTSEIDMPDTEIYQTYHNLWRIEESFKIMKSDLDARPVFLQKRETITGHFLICYLTVLLIRLLQFNVLEDKYSSNEILNLIKGFDVVKAGSKYINTSCDSQLIQELESKYNIPIRNYFLSETNIKHIFNCKM